MPNRLTKGIAALSLVLGVWATQYGFVHLHPQFASFWHGANLMQLLGLVGAIATLGLGLRRFFWRHLAVAWISILLGIVLPVAGIGSIAAIAVMVAAGSALGHAVLGDRILSRFSPVPALALATISGFGIFSFVISITSHFPINTPFTFSAGLALCIALNWRGVLGVSMRVGKLFHGINPPRPSVYALVLVLLAIVLVQLSFSLRPQIEFDSLEQHLHIPTTVWLEQQWSYDVVHDAGAAQPFGGEWLFSIGYLLGGETGAHLVNVLMFAFVLALLWEASGGLGGSGKKLLVLILTASIPIAFLEVAALYLENSLAAMLLGAFLLAVRSEAISVRHSVGFGLLLGAALQIKLLAVFGILPMVALWIVYRWSDHGWRKAVLATLLAGVPALIVACPPYVYAWVATGNPVLPFYNAIFHSPYFPAGRNFRDARRIGGLSYDLPYNLTFRSDRYMSAEPGAAGFLFLMLMPPGLGVAAIRRNRIHLSAAFIVIAYSVLLLWFVTSLRYVFPVMGLATLVCVAAADRAIGAAWEGIVLTLCMVALGLNVLYFPSAHWMLTEFRLDPLYSRNARVAILKQFVPVRRLAKVLEESVQEHPRVLLATFPYGTGFSEPYYLAWYNPTMVDELLAIRTDEGLANYLRMHRITHVIVSRTVDGKVHIDEALVNTGFVERLERVLGQFGTLVTETGRARLYRIHPDYLYDQDLLKNSHFKEGLTGWHASDIALTKVDRFGVVVPPGQILAQSSDLNFTQGRNLLVSVQVKCIDDGGILLVRLWWSRRGVGYDYDDGTVVCRKGETKHWSAVWGAPDHPSDVTLQIESTGNAEVLLQQASVRQ